MFKTKVKTASGGKDSASCFHVSSDSHQATTRGGGGFGSLFTGLATFLLGGVLLAAAVAACDPVTGTGSGTPPDPKRYLKVDPANKTAVVTLIAGYPASDFQFNYNGYTDGALVLKVPVGWEVTVQCANRSTVNNSCAVVADGHAAQPMQAGWSTPDPQHGLDPGQSASFVFTPDTVGSYRIASLVRGSEASGMWLDLEVISSGTPALSAP